MERVAPLLAPGTEPRVHGERVLLATLAGVEILSGENRELPLEWARRGWGDGALLEGTTPDDPVFPALTAGFGFAEEFAECEAVATAVIEEARRRGSVLGFATGCFLRGGHYLNWGRIPDAVADLEQSLAARSAGWTQYVPRAAGVLIQAQLLLGDVDRAEELAEELQALEAEHSHSILWSAALEGIGAMALHRGDAEGALAAFRGEGELAEALGARNPVALPWRSNAALALARLDRQDEAVALCDEEVEMARSFGVPGATAKALRARGIARGREGRDDLRAAVETADASESELQRCLTRLSYGVALRAAGKRTEATDMLRRALDSAELAGATAVAEQAREELHGLGARPRRARMKGVESLTPGELRVARMAGGGKTNRQIAEDLFVTPKAVQWHLTNAYRKLGVNSRDELAAVLGGETG
jgi:DNA-binding CsgD family transcriptional regulator